MRKVKIIKPNQLPFVKPYEIVNNFLGFQVADFVGIITMGDTLMEGQIANPESESPRLWPIDDDRLSLESLLVKSSGDIVVIHDPPLLKFDDTNFSGVLF